MLVKAKDKEKLKTFSEPQMAHLSACPSAGLPARQGFGEDYTD
jgi:hypothetical protein